MLNQPIFEEVFHKEKKKKKTCPYPCVGFYIAFGTKTDISHYSKFLSLDTEKTTSFP